MKKNDLAERLASLTQTTPAVAADQLDRIVHRILQSLKNGKPAELPGLGVFRPTRERPGFRFVPQTRKGAP
ncbi:MAG: HU family DNA-binding protein [Acidobacteria bacterium]|nr:HU family DNA-binding protein [Acidobacteriota bacterium]